MNQTTSKCWLKSQRFCTGVDLLGNYNFFVISQSCLCLLFFSHAFCYFSVMPFVISQSCLLLFLSHVFFCYFSVMPFVISQSCLFFVISQSCLLLFLSHVFFVISQSCLLLFLSHVFCYFSVMPFVISQSSLLHTWFLTQVPICILHLLLWLLWYLKGSIIRVLITM